MPDYYQILGVQPDATQDEIKDAWIFGRKAFDPEKFAGASQRERTAAQARMQAIHEAYGVLSNPSRRLRYDEQRGFEGRATAPPPPPPKVVSATGSNVPNAKVNPWKRILTGIFSPSGRIGRTSWLVRVQGLFGFFLALIVASFLLHGNGPLLLSILIPSLFVLLPIFWIQSVRRLHDVGWNGWWILLNLVPYIGGLFLLVVLALVQGSTGANRFGQPPETARATKVTAGVLGGAWLALLLLFAVGVARQSTVNPRRSAASPSPLAVWSPQPSRQSDSEKISQWLAEHPSLSPSPAQDMNARVQAPQGATEDRELDLPALAQQARRAVVLIVGYDASGKPIKTGSGFFVSEDGRLVTNWHVVDGIAKAQAKLENGAIYKIQGVLSSSSQLDLAVLKADARDVQFLSVDGATTPPEPGTRVAVIGSPLALEGSLSEGIVSAIRSVEDGNWLQISAPISEGSSGSPVLDRHGRVIGVATLTAKEGQNLNFARSSRDLTKFLAEIQGDAKPIAFAQPTPQQNLVEEPDYYAARNANERKDGAAALELVNKLSLRYPNSVDLLFQRALAYFYLGLYEDALSAYRKYVKIKPSEPAAWHNMTLAAFNANHYDDALNAGFQAVKMQPDADVWRVIGVIAASREDWASANLAVEQAKKIEAEQRNVSSAAPTTTSFLPGNRKQLYRVVRLPRGGELNVRANPRADSPVVAKLHLGDHVYFENERFQNGTTHWDKITSWRGQTGWVNTDYLSLEK